MIANLVRRLGHVPRKSRLAGVAVAVLLAVAALGPIAAGPALADSGASTIWPGGTGEPGPATYGVYTEDDDPFTMSDGAVLYGGSNRSVVNIPLVNPYALPATLSCVTDTSWLTPEPTEWNGGTHGPRNSAADTATCPSGINGNS